MPYTVAGAFMNRLSPKVQTVTRAILLLLALAAAAAATSATREVILPVRPDTTYLRHTIISQVFTDENQTARVWDDGSGCNFLVLSDPRVATAGDTVRLRSAAQARVGKRVGGRCIVITDWSGTIETTQAVALGPGGQAIEFDVVDSEIQDEAVRAGLPIGVIWDWVKQYVHPRLDTIRVDLAPALADLTGVLDLVLQPGRNGELHAALDSIIPRSVSVVEDGLLVHLGMQMPEAESEPAPPADALTPAELARFEAAWQGWDGFVTFVVKHFAAATAAPDVRRRLLDVLIEARYDLVDILASPPAERGPDPVRALFVDTWSRLAPVLRQMSPDMPRERAFNLLSFITAADALRALDELGPGFGLDISLDGLRRMARILAPDTGGDPLEYDERVDPELRELFEFGPPLKLRLRDDAGARGWWRSLIPEAHAEVEVDEKLVEQLTNRAPAPEEIEPYLQSVLSLLDQTIRGLLAQSTLDPVLHDMFRSLVLATAWQETCWRQYVRVDGRITPIRSPAGAVGMMQIMPSVWRGFYDPGGLTRDIAYNAAAGGEILMHYLVNYAIKGGEDRQPGGRDNLARATYAAYNGGPGHLRRYRQADANEHLRSIDAAFQDKYQRIRDGDELAVRACYSG